MARATAKTWAPTWSSRSRPRLRMMHSAMLGMDFVFPVSLGMSLHDYYQIPSRPTGKIQNDFLGYAAMAFCSTSTSAGCPRDWAAGMASRAWT